MRGSYSNSLLAGTRTLSGGARFLCAVLLKKRMILQQYIILSPAFNLISSLFPHKKKKDGISGPSRGHFPGGKHPAQGFLRK
jgi:hypothetical protein